MKRISLSVLTGILAAIIAYVSRAAYLVLSGYTLTFNAAAFETIDGTTLLNVVVLGPLIENVIILAIVFIFEKGFKSITPYASLLVIGPIAYWMHGAAPVDFIHAVSFSIYTILFIRLRSESNYATAYLFSAGAHGVANLIRILISLLPFNIIIGAPVT